MFRIATAAGRSLTLHPLDRCQPAVGETCPVYRGDSSTRESVSARIEPQEPAVVEYRSDPEPRHPGTWPTQRDSTGKWVVMEVEQVTGKARMTSGQRLVAAIFPVRPGRPGQQLAHRT